MQKKMYSAFTLVELLVVIGIVALLIALLLPALAKARRTAMQQVCASNLRQVVVAAYMYANDSKGALVPAGLIPDGSGNGVTMYWCYQQLTGIHGTTYSFKDGYLGHYLQTTSVLKCPETNDLVLPVYPYPCSTYALAQLSSYPYTGVVKNFSQIRKTSLTVCAADAIGFVPPTASLDYPGELLAPSVVGATGMEQFSGRHPSGKGNVGFFDGHVEAIAAYPKPGSTTSTYASIISAQHLGILTRGSNIDVTAMNADYENYATTMLDYYFWANNQALK